MSDADGDEVVVSEDELTVRKSIDTDRFQTLAVVFEVASDREEPARIQLTDVIPDGIPMEDVGFHPEFGSEYWATDDQRVVFERTMEPGEAYTTIYGIREVDEDTVADLLGYPDLDLIDIDEATEAAAGVPEEIREIDDLISEERSDAVRDVITGESEGLTDEAAADGADAAPDAPSPEPEPDTGAEAVAATGNPDGGEETGPIAAGDDDEVTVPVTGGVARVLAKELREGTVSDADRDELRDALSTSQGSTRTKISHLQARVSDLDAYTDAIEEFLDEEGGAAAVLEDVRSDVDAVRREVTRVDDAVDAVEDRLDDAVGRIDDRLNALEDTVGDLDDGLADVDRRVDAADDRMDDLRGDVDTLRDDLDEMDEFRQRLSQAFDAGESGSE